MEDIPLSAVVGWAFVHTHDGMLDADAARAILLAAGQASPDAAARILLRGSAVVSEEAAAVFVAAGISLIGVESQSVGPMDAPMAVHRILLSADVALLEGIRLADVEDGVYFLHAAPLLLGGAEGAPCRATLVKF